MMSKSARLTAIVWPSFVLLSALVWAQPVLPAGACSNGSLTGNYGFILNGIAGGNPIAIVGQISTNGSGNIAGFETTSLNGSISNGVEGKLTFLSRIKYAMDAITSFSYKPLRFSFVLAGFAIFLAAILAIFTIASNSPMSLLRYGVCAAIFLMGGLILLCLGVLGEYLERVYDEVRGRPLSIINKVYYTSQLKPAQVITEHSCRGT